MGHSVSIWNLRTSGSNSAFQLSTFVRLFLSRVHICIQMECERSTRTELRQNVWYIRTLFGIHRGSKLTYMKVLYANSLWCTDSRRIAFGCSPNIHHTAECGLPRLGNTSTLNIRIVFECCVRICILFAFRCKPGFRVIRWKLNHVTSRLMEKSEDFVLHGTFWGLGVKMRFHMWMISKEEWILTHYLKNNFSVRPSLWHENWHFS